MPRQCSLPAIAVLCFATPLLACMWDFDTLQQERSRFPSVLELITGKFPRHSEEFYRWRIEDRQERLKSAPDNLALYDDIAVAWDKLGEPEQAVAVMQEKEAIKPGEYETLANLGTFHIHAGRLDEGAEYIRLAIEINPDAHFGREVYQLRLVEYLQSRRRDDGSIPQPLNTEDERYPDMMVGFATFLLGEDHHWTKATRHEHALAIQGVLGMMRFGHYDSPILLEALGDLLSSGEMTHDTRQLAARAYLRASQEAQDQAATDAFYQMADAVASNQYPIAEGRRKPGQSHDNTPAAVSVIEAELASELANAEEWIAKVHDDERRWIADEGVNPDVEFAKRYAAEPTVSTPNNDKPIIIPGQAWRHITTPTLISLVLAAFGAVAICLWILRRRMLVVSGEPNTENAIVKQL